MYRFNTWKYVCGGVSSSRREELVFFSGHHGASAGQIRASKAEPRRGHQNFLASSPKTRSPAPPTRMMLALLTMALAPAALASSTETAKKVNVEWYGMAW